LAYDQSRLSRERFPLSELFHSWHPQRLSTSTAAVITKSLVTSPSLLARILGQQVR
jgi:hypothetical protein